MPSHYSAIIHANVPILSTEADPSRPSSLFQHITSKLWIDETCNVNNITTHLLPLEISMFFPDISEIPDEGCLVMIEGILLVHKSGEDITLYIKGLHMVQ